ncbi:MAG: hypothetical protein CMN76_21380 [Spirochaetaceae bacterium]|nr:hypothetical protein [Spirochaetaceae bacterium]|tara:strand:- start:21737 stop:22516 length:780 start_codon:yes stop_codon:yes gene_type:complete
MEPARYILILALAMTMQCSPFYAALLGGSGSSGTEESALVLALLSSSENPAGKDPADPNILPPTYRDYLVYLTTAQPDGDMQYGGEPICDMVSGNPITRADCYCMLDSNNPDPMNSTFKAFLAGGSRIATDSPDCGAGCTNQSSWVLDSYGNYKDEGGATIFVTGANPIFDPDNPLELQNSLRYGMASASFWTGVSPDWTKNPSNCSDWTDGGAGQGLTGRSTSLNSAFLAHNSAAPCENNGGPGGGKVNRLMCVQVPD